ncbi:MAG TPA: hypothetical protein VFZ11_08470 [Gemmatimonadaceae bacterium]
MLLLLSALLVLQSQDPTARDTLRADAPHADTGRVAHASPDTVRRRRGNDDDRIPGSSLPRIPVTEEIRRSAFTNAGAREILDGARRARLAGDAMLSGYDAKSVMRVSAGLGFKRLGRQRLLFRGESAARIRWQRDVGARMELTGERIVLPSVLGMDHDDEVSTEVEGEVRGPSGISIMNSIPYFPGSESMWIGLGRARAEVDPDQIIHPLAAGAEAYYRYARGDSMVTLLPNARRTRLVELEVRPRQPHWRLVVGSLWFDADTRQLVRAAYRLAAPMDIWKIIEEEEDDDDVPAAVKAMITPMTFMVSTVVLEYGLFEGRFWLPRGQSLEGSVEVGMMRVPLEIEERFSYASVNGADTIPRFVVDRPRPDSWRDSLADSGAVAAADTAGPDSVRIAMPGAEVAVRDSAGGSVSIQVGTGARGDGRPRVLNRGLWAQCDSSSVRVTTEWRHNGEVPVQLVAPCDTLALASSPDLPASIYDAGEPLFSEADRDILLDAIGLSAQPEWSPQDPELVWGLSHNLVRYNRVEGLSAGAGMVQALGAGYGLEATARIGVADWQPNGELALARSNGRDSVRLAVAQRLVAANDWGSPFGFGPSLNAFLFGRDEGMYYRTLGVELAGARLLGAGVLDWRLFAERQRGADVETHFSLPHLFAGTRALDNIDAARADEVGAALRHVASLGLDPRGWRLLADLRMEGAAGTFDYSRGALDLTISHPIADLLDGALTFGAGTTGGRVPPQRLYYVGGTRSVRGQLPGIVAGDEGVGNAYWLGRLELGLGAVGARPVLFGDIGWAGDRRDFGTGRPMSGAGVGFSVLDGLIRFDIARGIRPRDEVRAAMYLEAGF